MAAYPNYPKGETTSGPQPYYAGPPAPKQPSILLKKGHGGRRLGCSIVGCLVAALAVGGGGVGSCAFYTKWYLPQKARQYIEATEPSFRQTSGIVADIRKNLQAVFDERKVDGSDRKGADVTVREIEEANALAQKLLEKTSEARKAMPQDSSIAEGLDRSLLEYYDLTEDLAKSYSKLIAFHEATKPVVKSLDTVFAGFDSLQLRTLDDLASTAEDFKKQAEQLEAVKQDLGSRDAPEEAAGIREPMIALADGLAKYLDETARALKTLRAGAKKWSSSLIGKSKKDSKHALEHLRVVLQAYDEGRAAYDRKIKEKYTENIEEIVDKGLLVEKYFASLKEKHGVK
jgi:hypothetical protein